MLDDRPYMKSVSFGSVCPAVKAILWTNAGIFVLQALLEKWGGVYVIRDVFALSQEGLARGYVFQFISYQFLHGDLWHLLANLLVIYFIGKEMERVLGRKSFLVLYFSAGVLGGLLQIALSWIVPLMFPNLADRFPDVPVVGASAAAFGLVAAFAAMFPNQPITLLLFFVLPVSFRARTLLWIALALAIFGIVAMPESRVAHGAHLGGLCAGVAYVYYIVGGRWRFQKPAFSRRSPQRRSGGKPWAKVPPVAKKGRSGADFISREVDPILDKISEQGIHSLTEKERRLLESARSKMKRD